LAKHDRAADVPNPGAQLGAPVLLARMGPGFGEAEGEEGDHRHRERRGVEDHDRLRSNQREQAGAGQRRDQAEGPLDRPQGAVGVRQEFWRKQRRQQRRLTRAQQRVGEAVDDHHGVDQPQLTGAVDEQQEEHSAARERVRGHQERAASDPVDDQTGDRCEQHRRREEKEHEPRCGAAVGELLDPHGHRQPQRRVAERGHRLPGQEDAGIAHRQQLPRPHRYGFGVWSG